MHPSQMAKGSWLPAMWPLALSRTVLKTPGSGLEDAAELPKGLAILSPSALISYVQKLNGGSGEIIHTHWEPHHKASGWRLVIQYSEPQVAMQMSNSTTSPCFLYSHLHISALMFSFLLASQCSDPTTTSRLPTLFLRTARNRDIYVQVGIWDPSSTVTPKELTSAQEPTSDFTRRKFVQFQPHTECLLRHFSFLANCIHRYPQQIYSRAVLSHVYSAHNSL